MSLTVSITNTCKMLNQRKIVYYYPIRQALDFEIQRADNTFHYEKSFINTRWSMLENPCLVAFSNEREAAEFLLKRAATMYSISELTKRDFNNVREAVSFGIPHPFDNILLVLDHNNKFIKDHQGEYLSSVELKSYVAYGRLYTHQVTQNQLLPAGWTVPSDDDYANMISFVNSLFTPPPPLVLPQRAFFMFPRYQLTPSDDISHPRWDHMFLPFLFNNMKYNGLPGGERSTLGTFELLGEQGTWWCSDPSDRGRAQARSLSISMDSFFARATRSTIGTSIRCIRDATPEELVLPEGSFCGIIRDFDGNMYQTIKVHDKVWTAQNFAGTHYFDGTPIPHITDNSQWESLTDQDDAYCDYLNDESLSFFSSYENIIY